MTVHFGKHRFPSVHQSQALSNGVDIWMGDRIRETKSTDSDIEIDLQFITSNSFTTQPKIKDFLCNIFEFINLLWSLIFIKSIRCILEVQQDREVEQLGERSAQDETAGFRLS